MARAAKKETPLTTEEKLAKALVPEEEQPYPVPGNWCWTTIRNINLYVSDSVDPSIYPTLTFELYSVPSSNVGYPEIVSGQDIGSTKQTVIVGDVLLCKINPRINRVWKVSQFTEHKCLASSEWIIVRNAQINSNYLMYCFRSPYFRKYMLSNVSGVGGSLMRARPKYVENYPIPLPPLPEQQRIVSLIESLFADLDAAKKKLQAVLDGFAERRAALLHQAFTGELTREWREEQGVGVESWDDLSFDDCVDKMQNGLSKRKGSSGENYAVLRLADIGEDGISMDDLRYILLNDKEQEKYALCDGDVLMIRVNGSRDNVGRQIYVKNPSRLAFCDHLIRIRYKTQCFARYMCLITHTNKYRQYIKEHMVSTAGQNTISRRGMQAFNVKLPTLPEQKEIVRILDDIFTKESQAKAAVESTLAKIDTMKNAILATAFRGGFETNNSSDESAKELLRKVL